MRYLNLNQYAIRFLYRNLKREQFLIIAGILVGLTTGFAAIILKSLVHYIHLVNEYQMDLFPYPYLNLFLPLIGIILTVWVVKNFLKGRDGRGVSNILIDISQHSGVIPKYKMYSQIIASSLTVGFGGSSGLEGPIAVTGSAIGSNFARVYRLSYKERVLLLACGTASGIATVFNAPITGLMFAIEVILVGVVFSDFIPLIISAVSGSLLSKIILNDDILFDFKNLKEFDYNNVFFYILLGIICGLISIYYGKVTLKIEHFFKDKLQWGDYSKALLGGLILAILCFIFPPLFGEGYYSIKLLASGSSSELLKGSFFNITLLGNWAVILFTGLIMFTKVFATSVTLSSGGSGGNFAPALFTGAFTGFLMGSIINETNYFLVPVNNFTLVGMCGILSGVMYAPLTGIFLIAEITGGYELIIPLMIVSTSSFAIAKFFEPYSMDVKHLIKKKEIFTENFDQNILSLIKVHEIIEHDTIAVNENTPLTKLLEKLKYKYEKIIICNNDNEAYTGYILVDDLTKVVISENELGSYEIAKILNKSNFKFHYNQSISLLADYFENEGLLYVPVFEDEIFIGLASKMKLLVAYRNRLKNTLS